MLARRTFNATTLVASGMFILLACSNTSVNSSETQTAIAGNPTTAAVESLVLLTPTATPRSIATALPDAAQDAPLLAPSPTLLPTIVPLHALAGTVSNVSSEPLNHVTVSINGRKTLTDFNGRFLIPQTESGDVLIERPAWESAQVTWDGSPDELNIVLDPLVVRALRVSAYAPVTAEGFANLLDLAEDSSVNGLVFDTKDESGFVRYNTEVQTAADINSVRAAYDPAELLPLAHERGLYTITRIVTFEDPIRTSAQPETRAAGKWIDPANHDNWQYPLDLAVEACELGFDEVQFDYVRFPTGVGGYQRPVGEDVRIAHIVGFLTAAREALHPMGCALSADIFGIVLSSVDDQGIGQVPEALSEVVDALSPMVYPSHYSNGWLGFAYPNDHNAAVTGDALDTGSARMVGNAILRPWLQAFWYEPWEIRAGIDATDERGLGWILWEAGGSYLRSSLPDSESL